MADFVLVRASLVREALPSGFAARDGMGYFLLWLMLKAEKMNTGSNNILAIPNAKTAKALAVSPRTIIQWKQKCEAIGIIKHISGKSLFRLNSSLIYKGKMIK